MVSLKETYENLEEYQSKAIDTLDLKRHSIETMVNFTKLHNIAEQKGMTEVEKCKLFVIYFEIDRLIREGLYLIEE